MALLRNLEQSLSGLMEGTFGRVFRNEVRPTEIARKLAREMEINKRVSLSRTYAPTDYLVYLSPEDRARYAGVEHSIAEELGAYLLEHARRERLVLVRRPLVEFRTDQRLHLGEFGIEARTAPISAEEAPPRPDPVAEAPARQPAPRATPEERAKALEPDPDFRPATPLGAEPLPVDDAEEPGYAGLDEEAYEDPYAGDPFDDDVSQPDDDRWHEAPAAHVDFDDEPAPGPAPAGTYAEEPQQADPADDWLDPVDPWDADPADDAPAASAPKPDPIPAPPRLQPRAAQAPGPVAQPSTGADPSLPPWIDPTLARQQQRAPIAPPVSPPPLRPRTTIVVDGTPHELHGDVIVLGRSRSADIVVSDPSISRRHLELRRDERGWYALDLGSTNGSQINGAPVAEPRRLEPGMRIKLGHAPALIEVR